jgi:aminoglycoside phosphotransferase family enzyme
MSLTTNWSTKYDRLIWEAIVEGRVTGELYGKPTEVIESGLAHIFFYGDTVYKLYKTHDDKDHFIKGVFAPTEKRAAFIQHDFFLNQHFSSDVYRKLHSVYYRDGGVDVGPFVESSIYTLVEMDRLDFNNNLHELLLRGEIDAESMYLLGHETAHGVATCTIKVPDSVNWYALAAERVTLLKQFVDWLPPSLSQPVRQSSVLERFDEHLERHREEYESIKGDLLTINIDNHDENVFFTNGRPQFIDLLPPMDCWWFGLPYANLSNLMANVEVLHSVEMAKEIERGYFDYFGINGLPAHSYAFTHAFAYMISIAHFGSVPGKEAVAERYLVRLDEVSGWL